MLLVNKVGGVKIMRWDIEYIAGDCGINKMRVMYIIDEIDAELVINNFEKLHNGRVAVISCLPKYIIEQKIVWQLNRVDDIGWVQDGSGINVVISWDAATDSVRLDLMAEADTKSLQSFVGRADNVRKAVMQWFASALYGKVYLVSLEHAAYIGAELERCDTERIDYIQD